MRLPEKRRTKRRRVDLLVSVCAALTVCAWAQAAVTITGNAADRAQFLTLINTKATSAISANAAGVLSIAPPAAGGDNAYTALIRTAISSATAVTLSLGTCQPGVFVGAWQPPIPPNPKATASNGTQVLDLTDIKALANPHSPACGIIHELWEVFVANRDGDTYNMNAHPRAIGGENTAHTKQGKLPRAGGRDPGPNAGFSNCCFSNDTPGCDNAQCEAIVCANDPFCCDFKWDNACVAEAFHSCSDICGAPPYPGCSPTRRPNPTPTGGWYVYMAMGSPIFEGFERWRLEGTPTPNPDPEGRIQMGMLGSDELGVESLPVPIDPETKEPLNDIFVAEVIFLPTGDCNQNGIPDGEDIFTDFSTDVNCNGVPDECEGCPEDCQAAPTSGAVDVPDLLALLAAWGGPQTPGTTCDLDGSGAIAVPDLLQLLAAWGPCP